MMKKHGTIIWASLLLGLPAMAWGQSEQVSAADTNRVEPIESARLQGSRMASEAEKAYARHLAEEREEQEQIDYNLPPIDENGQVRSFSGYDEPYYYDRWLYGYGWGFDRWRLHKGLNVNVSASVFANFGNGMGGNGAGFSQDVTLMYVTNLSRKATLAIGGYINNLTYGGTNYTTGGINALLAYRWNEHWSAYAYVQKAINGEHILPYYGYGHAGWGSPYWGSRAAYGWGGYGYGAFGRYPGWGYGPSYSRAMDRVGGGVTYQWGENNQNSISVNVEVLHRP